MQYISFLLILFLMPGLCYGAISNAKPIDLNTPVIGSLPKGDTKNFYSFTLPSAGYIRIDFEHENLTENHRGWRIKVLSEDSKDLEYFSSRWNQPEVSSANIGLPQGRYYVLVYQEYDVHNSADYSLTVNYTASDFWEKEPNETILAASENMLNQAYTGSLNSGKDNDYYSFTLPSAGYIRVDFEHENLTENHRGWRIKVLSEDSKDL
ncbi:MAG: hypothetical protein U1E11_06925, partial [Dethiobacteria bacterium]|nr:hypothetical protein [Dethiobacteria bacterium]